MADDRHERISRRAHAIWEREGRRHGEHERHWHQAASEIDAEAAAQAAGTKAEKPVDRAAKPAATAAGKAASRTRKAKAE